jgi:hypothetical protein
MYDTTDSIATITTCAKQYRIVQYCRVPLLGGALRKYKRDRLMAGFFVM